MSKSVDDLVASIPEAHHGVGCWAQSLTGRAAAFVEGVKSREDQGVKLLRGAIVDTLKREFGVNIGSEALRRHLAGRCRCFQ